MIERAEIKLVDVTGIEPATPCLQAQTGWPLLSVLGNYVVLLSYRFCSLTVTVEYYRMLWFRDTFNFTSLFLAIDIEPDPSIGG
jgi:hypothetical protein